MLLPNGSEVLVYPGDWIIAAGSQIIDVASAKAFPERYERIHDGALQLDRATCVLLEEITGIGTTKDPETLRQAVMRLARIGIGNVQIPFTPGQLEEIAHRAAKRGWTVEKEVQRIVDRIKDELFYHS